MIVELAERRKYHGMLCLERCLLLDEIDDHRNEECERYPYCLEHAAVLRWESFSCMFCDCTFEPPGWKDGRED